MLPSRKSELPELALALQVCIVLHNTAVLTFAQWHSVPGEQRIGMFARIGLNKCGGHNSDKIRVRDVISRAYIAWRPRYRPIDTSFASRRSFIDTEMPMGRGRRTRDRQLLVRFHPHAGYDPNRH
jgi:hypothetical protein